MQDPPVIDYRSAERPQPKRVGLRVLTLMVGGFGLLAVLLACGFLALDRTFPREDKGLLLLVLVFALIGAVCIAFAVRWGRAAFSKT